ncbi:endo-1,4-beta-xylanase [Flavobacterium circumlabens]|uniref:Beta-xylanase n=1 Tax=Flavobacterium circumlabens TaxID=2133765 RepID=A0A4Y7U5W6_9FLAO|nr:endo-1,4-beta-xylanase [Flavobacterium circumlabens]TCN50714.1 endo-1,4-beta-xylanase [Flavobacterium circumlabens]TEB41815.1 endo-1,4-beta-xylanase [Flavobacterium circumlabens]
MRLINRSLLLLSVVILSSCNAKKEKEKNAVSLKDSYKNDFYIGTALSADQIEEKNAKEDSLIQNEFNAITAENIMKSMFIHPQKDKYDFALADKFVAYGKKNKMFIHGHTLIWHSQLAPWIEKIKDSTEMRAFMKDHITTIVSKYKGKVDSWDVVNEALNEDGTLRKSIFLNTLGEKYLSDAFKYAAAADPKVDLYYNDYNNEEPAKRAGNVDLIKKIKAAGGKIDGVGIQAHWKLTYPSLEEIEKSILEYSALGVKVAFTELDISVLPNPKDLNGADVNQNFEGDPKMNPYPKTLPDSVQVKLAARYASIFKLFLKHKDKISRVTFWGVHDGQSWLNDWPVKGRTNYPLLFDKDLKPKKAYNSVIQLKEIKQ